MVNSFTGTNTVSTVTMDIKQRQLFILKLLKNVLEPVLFKDCEEIGRNFNIEENVQLYTVSSIFYNFGCFRCLSNNKL